MSMSRVISGNNSVAYESCYLPELNSSESENIRMITAKQIESVQRDAYREGVNLGRRDAFDKFSGQLQSLVRSIADTLSEFDEKVVNEIAALIITCARELVRCELSSNPEMIVAAVREALELLPLATREVSIHMHPEDCVVISDAFAGDNKEYKVKIIQDPLLSRGGCMVFSEESQIDASIESRLAAVVKQMLEDDLNHNAT